MYVAVFIDPKDSDHPEVFGYHELRDDAIWHAEDVLVERFPVEWESTRDFIPDPTDTSANEVLNAWNSVAGTANYLPFVRVVELTSEDQPWHRMP